MCAARERARPGGIMRERDMTAGSPARLIILFALPMMAGNVCQQLYTIVDAAFVGQAAGFQALAAVGATELRDLSPNRLSGGEKKRVAIATILAMEPSILVMDEPTAALDPLARQQLLALLRSVPHTTLIATHDLELVRELCPRVLVLHRGTLVADGPADRLLADRDLLTACEIV